MAKLPPLLCCVLGEQARPEPTGRSTILGFFGVSPIAELLMAVPGNIPLCIMLLCEVVTEPGDFAVDVEIHGPREMPVMQRTRVGGYIEVLTGKRAYFVINIQGLPITQFGKYKINIYSMGEFHSSSTFAISAQ